MARLLLIRHAPTAETGKTLSGRLPGIHLGEEGRALAQETSERLRNLRIRAVYASPIERTWETAQIIAEPHRVAPLVEDGLLEVDYGSWSGRSLASLYRLKAWRTVQTTPSRMRFPGGESIADAQRRAVGACERMAAENGKGTIAAVSHSDVIKSIVSHYAGQPLDLFQRIVISPTSVTVIDIPRQGIPTLVAVNSTGGAGSWR